MPDPHESLTYASSLTSSHLLGATLGLRLLCFCVLGTLLPAVCWLGRRSGGAMGERAYKSVRNAVVVELFASLVLLAGYAGWVSPVLAASTMAPFWSGLAGLVHIFLAGALWGAAGGEARQVSVFQKVGCGVQGFLWLGASWGWRKEVWVDGETVPAGIVAVLHGAVAVALVFALVQLFRCRAGMFRTLGCMGVVLFLVSHMVPLLLGHEQGSKVVVGVEWWSAGAVVFATLALMRWLIDAQLRKALEADERLMELESTLAERQRELHGEARLRQLAESSARARAGQALRFQNLLLSLAREDKSHTEAAITSLLYNTTQALEIERASFWTADDKISSITCQYLWVRGAKVLDAPHICLYQSDYPAYFEALGHMTQIVADDARTHPDTHQLRENYLQPFGISAMMDIPVWQHGKFAGILCCEDVGPPHPWTQQEQDFATMISQMVAQTMESAKIRHTELELRRSRAQLDAELARAH